MVAWQSPVDMSIIRHRIEYALDGWVDDGVSTQVPFYPKSYRAIPIDLVTNVTERYMAPVCKH